MRYPWSKPKQAPALPAPKPQTCKERRSELAKLQRRTRAEIAGMEPAPF